MYRISVINPKTSIDSFKTAFEGCDYKGEKPLKWITKQKNHIVYLFDLLLEKKLIHNHIEKDDSYIKINLTNSFFGKINTIY